MVWPEYVAGKGFDETASALIGELYRCSTGAGHLSIHTDGCCSEFLNWAFCNLCGRLGFGIISGPLCIALSRVSSSFQLFAQKYGHLPPPLNPHISKTVFSHSFKKYTHSPPREGYFQKLQEKCQDRVGAQSMSPRDIVSDTKACGAC